MVLNVAQINLFNERTVQYYAKDQASFIQNNKPDHHGTVFQAFILPIRKLNYVANSIFTVIINRKVFRIGAFIESW